MIKYVKKWVEWCDSCGHGFKVNANNIQSISKTKKQDFLSRLLRRKPEIEKTELVPEPSPCPVCDKSDNVTVIKLQEDKVTVEMDSE